MEQGAGKEGRLEMKVTGIAGIQCAILLMVLLAEIAFTGGYHTISDSMEQDAGVWEECASDIQEKSVSDMSDESISVCRIRKKLPFKTEIMQRRWKC